MQSKAGSVTEYLSSLPPDRRSAIQTVRAVILANLDQDYEEGMQYGLIGYYVPHRVYPAGYHVDPKQPLPFAGLASQKNHMALYLMSVYDDCGKEGRDAPPNSFRAAWLATGKKLDMGKCCVRFKRIEDVALDVVGDTIRAMPANRFIARCEAALADSTKNRAARKSAVKS